MIKRVKLDKNHALTEVDWKSIDRSARVLDYYIKNASVDEAIKFEYLERVTPLIERVFNRTVTIPITQQEEPYNIRYIIEGIEPEFVERFGDLYAELMLKLSASPDQFSLSKHESGKYILGKYREYDEEGNQYELCWFED